MLSIGTICPNGNVRTDLREGYTPAKNQATNAVPYETPQWENLSNYTQE